MGGFNVQDEAWMEHDFLNTERKVITMILKNVYRF
jgi:hypothetical protein